MELLVDEDEKTEEVCKVTIGISITKTLNKKALIFTKRQK